ncbi:hypothetical protein [Brachybacterium tyrofermentans]|uniref:hypothetical protein n=1 Tax=Brachybacterium tyrofermentans TaxID=47848 RepID=UPI003FD436A6
MICDQLPTISRTEHKARVARGEKASGAYAHIFPRVTTIQEHLTHSFDVRDEDDRVIIQGATTGPTMARMRAMQYGATFFVDSL